MIKRIEGTEKIPPISIRVIGNSGTKRNRTTNNLTIKPAPARSTINKKYNILNMTITEINSNKPIINIEIILSSYN